MSQKKYVSLSKLGTFLDNLTTKFATLIHSHTISDITDYTVDSELSTTSTNPIANNTVNAEFDAVGDAMGALELAIDTHTHVVSDITNLTVSADELNFVSGITSNIQNQLDVLTNRIFIGTKEQYKTANKNNQIPINTIVILTDDEDLNGGSIDDSTVTSSLLGTGVLGYMILG